MLWMKMFVYLSWCLFGVGITGLFFGVIPAFAFDSATAGFKALAFSFAFCVAGLLLAYLTGA